MKMSENKEHIESDLLMRLILSDAREEVPEHVWENISSKLDAIQAKPAGRVVAVRFRRYAAAVAAAAVVAVGLFLGLQDNSSFDQSYRGSGMIAVVSPEISVNTDFGKVPAIRTDRMKKDVDYTPIPVYLADAEDEVKKAKDEVEKARDEVEKAKGTAGQTVEKDTEEMTYFPEDWGEDEDRSRRRPATSLVFSGSAATNNTSNAGTGPFRSPSADNIAPSTGVVPGSSESTYGLPVTFGAGVKIGLSPRWSLGTGLNYTLLSRKFFGTYTKVSQGVVEETATSDIRNTQHYIGIPINAYYSIVNKELIDFYVYGGGAVEKCVSNKYNILNTAYNYTESVKGVQLSAAVGLGVEFILGRNLGLYFDPSLRYSFDCGQPKSIRTARPLMLGIEMGLRINL